MGITARSQPRLWTGCAFIIYPVVGDLNLTGFPILVIIRNGTSLRWLPLRTWCLSRRLFQMEGGESLVKHIVVIVKCRFVSLFVVGCDLAELAEIRLGGITERFNLVATVGMANG